MKNDFLIDLLGNVARAKILRLFILNENDQFTLREIEKRCSASNNIAHREVKALEKMGVVKMEKPKVPRAEDVAKVRKPKKPEPTWTIDENFKHIRALSTFVHEVAPAQYREVEDALRGTGRLSAVVLSGVFIGDPTRPADLLVVGDYVNEKRLERAVKSFEPKYGREIRYTVLSTPEFRYRMTISDRLVRDMLDFPHRVLLNKGNLL